ncbi:DNA-directed RNA polymerase subunit N [Candidatus Micrarchaeota archaeon]|nr:DNA-directed RNA polymerase subunit N [Candidatus Micrarchaeota archaeon]
MEFPVRCFSCGAVIGQYYEKYLKLVEEGKSKKEALDELGIDKYCCRRMFISHVDMTEMITKYERKE